MSIECTSPKIHGMVTVNAKGQIVIPSDVRALLDIHEGDQFAVISKDSYGLGLIKADNLQDFILAIQQHHPEAFSNINNNTP